jgi:methylase of polypeptide subunit release factors
MSALRCAERNIHPELQPSARLTSIHAPGIRNIGLDMDLIVSNPPYIPKPKANENNPYEGTGLIREIVAEGLSHLNPKNPNAPIVLNVSSLGMGDFNKYIAGRNDLKVKTLEKLTVPLKINMMQFDRKWMQYLVEKCGLERRDEYRYGYPYWHTLNIIRISRKDKQCQG